MYQLRVCLRQTCLLRHSCDGKPVKTWHAELTFAMSELLGRSQVARFLYSISVENRIHSVIIIER